MSAGLALQSVLGVGVAVANLAYWWWVVRHGDARFERWVARRFDVTIGRGTRGHWQVVAPDRSWPSRVAIELLQLVLYLAAMLVWGVALLTVLAVFEVIDRALPAA